MECIQDLFIEWDVPPDITQTFIENGVTIELLARLTVENLKELCPHLATRIHLQEKVADFITAHAPTESVVTQKDGEESNTNLIISLDDISISQLLATTTETRSFPNFDLETLLKTTPEGNNILNFYETNRCLNTNKRNQLTDIIIKHIYTHIVNGYGREDEEVMGLKFCNEAIMSLAQIWPVHCNHEREPNTPLQDALIKRLGVNAYPFQLELTPLAPPSVQLVPAKQYHGAPIGTSYDVRAYIADRADEKVTRRNTVRMGIRVLQGAGRSTQPASLPPPSPHHTLTALAHHNVLRLKNKAKLETDENCRPKRGEIENVEAAPPRAAVEKPFLLSDGRVELEAWLDKATYSHGESINVSVVVANHSSKTVRRIKTLVVQHVDVCMFSNGKFKNVVAMVKCSGTPVIPGQTLTDMYTLTPHRGVTKNWIALEDSYSKTGASLASTVLCNNSPEDRNVFAIYVSYYVKVKLTLSAMGGDLSVKLPFTLTHSCINEAPTDSVTEEATPKIILEGKENSEEEDSKCEIEKDKQNNNGGNDNQQTAFTDEAEATSPEDHRLVADVLVNIENKIERPKVFEGTEVRPVKPNEEELDLIVKYPGSDT